MKLPLAYAGALLLALIAPGWAAPALDGEQEAHAVAVCIAINRPGATAASMEKEVTAVAEEALSAVPKLDHLRSETSEGLSTINLFFSPSYQADVAASDARKALEACEARLPADIEPPLLRKFNPFALPQFWLTLQSEEFSSADLGAMAESILVPPLERLPGVGAVRLVGAAPPCIRIQVEPDKLAALCLDAGGLSETLEKQLGEAATQDDLSNLIVAMRNDAPVRLRDVAWLETAHEPQSFARRNGRPVVAIGLNSASPSASLGSAVNRFRESLPAGVYLEVAHPAEADDRLMGPLLIEAMFLPGTTLAQRQRELSAVEARFFSLQKAGFRSTLLLGADAQNPGGTDRLLVWEDREVARMRTPPFFAHNYNSQDFVRRAERVLSGYPGIRFSVRSASARYPLELRLQGPDPLRLEAWRKALKLSLQASGAVSDVHSRPEPSAPRERFSADPEKLAQLGIPPPRVSAALQLCGRGQLLGKFAKGDSRAEVWLSYPQQMTPFSECLERIQVTGRDGTLVKLSSLGSMAVEEGPAIIHRYNRQPVIYLSAKAASDVGIDVPRTRTRVLAEVVRLRLELSAEYQAVLEGW